MTSATVVNEGFHMTELGLMPSDWEVVKLGDVAYFETGRRMKGGALEKGEVLSLGGEHIVDSGNIDLCKPKFISKDFYNGLSKGKIRNKDVIICKDGARTGKVAYIKFIPSQYMAVNEHVFIVRSKDDTVLCNQFIYYFLFSALGQSQVREAYHGLIGGITNSNISNFKILLPVLSEQKRIAYILSRVQTAIEKTEGVIRAIRELKKSLMKHLFTYGPVNIDETGRTLLKETEIGLVPEGWEMKPLVDIATLQRGKDLPKQEQIWGEYPVVGSSGIMAYHNQAPCKGPGVVTGRSGSIGNLSYIEGDYWPHNTGLYVKDFHNNNPKFTYYLLHLIDFKKYATGVSVPTLNRNFVHAALLPVPPSEVQHNIADILTTVDRRIETEENKKKALEALFDTLLSNLMTGRIRVDSLEVPI